jgi:hypothetical protein
VSTKTLTVAALEESFVAVDTTASQAGIVDNDGLPLVRTLSKGVTLETARSPRISPASLYLNH